MKEVSDLGLVTALIALGYAPRGRSKEGRRVVFLFDSLPEIDEIEENFFNHNLPIDALTFHSTMKSVKQSIYRTEHE